jgi:glycine/D-amino acid oxidase-like deaminating enzyme
MVRTARNVYSAARLVVTAGSWASRMLADLGAAAGARETLHWFATEDDRLFQRDVFPIYMFRRGGFYYGFPVIDPTGHKPRGTMAVRRLTRHGRP